MSDGELQANATLTVTVTACTGNPRATDALLRTGYQQPIAIDLSQYGSGGTISSADTPFGGGAAGVYTPPAGENGNVVFRYTVTDECGGTATGAITVDVNQDPVAGALTIPLGLGSSQTVPVSQLASDAEPLTITALQGDVPGWVGFGPSELRINPTAVGSATFGVVVADPGGLTAVATVTVNVVNNTPVAVDDTVDVTAGDVTVDLLANDSDPRPPLDRPGQLPEPDHLRGRADGDADPGWHGFDPHRPGPPVRARHDDVPVHDPRPVRLGVGGHGHRRRLDVHASVDGAPDRPAHAPADRPADDHHHRADDDHHHRADDDHHDDDRAADHDDHHHRSADRAATAVQRVRGQSRSARDTGELDRLRSERRLSR